MSPDLVEGIAVLAAEHFGLRWRELAEPERAYWRDLVRAVRR